MFGHLSANSGYQILSTLLAALAPRELEPKRRAGMFTTQMGLDVILDAESDSNGLAGIKRDQIGYFVNEIFGSFQYKGNVPLAGRSLLEYIIFDGLSR